MIRIPVVFTLFLLSFCATCLGQTSFQGLTPGASTRGEVSKALGQPVRALSDTLLEYSPPAGIGKVLVSYRGGSSLVERVEVYFLKPISRGALLQKLNAPQRADAKTMNAEGQLVEYFGGQSTLALTYQSSDAGSGVTHVGYCSRELFESAVAKIPGARQNHGAQSGSSRNDSGAVTGLRDVPLPEYMRGPAGSSSVSVDRSGRGSSTGNSSCLSSDPGASAKDRSVHYSWAQRQTSERLIGNLRSKLGMLFECGRLNDEDLANAFADISVLVARYVPRAECFGGNRGVTDTDRSSHETWALGRGRQQLINDIVSKVSAAMKCLDRNGQVEFFTDVSVVIAQSAG